MQEKYVKFNTNQGIPFKPVAAFDTSRKVLVHLYENTVLDPSTFQSEVSLYLTRKESFSGNVATVHKLQDQQVAFKEGGASMEVTVVTDYVPWRLHLCNPTLTYEQALFLLDGSLKGLRELLHKLKTPFFVESYMIGVDGNGGVKVWWNEHFFRNKFSFNLSSEIKLKDMVMSLINCLTLKMNQKDSKILRNNILSGEEISFVILQRKVNEMSRGLNLQFVGKNMVSQDTDIAFASRKCLQMSQVNQTQPQLMRSNVSEFRLSSMVTPEMSRRTDDKLITKRTYKDGTAPPQVEKMNIIRQDIQKLRTNKDEVSNKSRLMVKHSRSLTNVVSYDRGVYGDSTIPQVRNIMRQSAIVESTYKPMVSRFIEPTKSQIITPSSDKNPEECDICSGVQNMRKSQISFDQSQLQLSRIKSLQSSHSQRELFSTERSRMQSSIVNARFGESDKKLPSNMYFASVL